MKNESKKNLLFYSEDLLLQKNFGELLNKKCQITFCNTISKLNKELTSKFYNLVIIDLENEIENILDVLQKNKSEMLNSFTIIFYGYRFNKPQFDLSVHSLADSLFYKPLEIENVLFVIEKKLCLESKDA